MFDIGFPELLIVSVVVLLVFGPERLPEVLRTTGRWFGAARRSFDQLKAEIEREVGADDIRRDLHNSRIMEEARALEKEVKASKDEVEEMLGKRWAALEEDGAVPAKDAGEEKRDALGADDPAAARATTNPDTAETSPEKASADAAGGNGPMAPRRDAAGTEGVEADDVPAREGTGPDSRREHDAADGSPAADRPRVGAAEPSSSGAPDPDASAPAKEGRRAASGDPDGTPAAGRDDDSRQDPRR